jgi:hypothetical protein
VRNGKKPVLRIRIRMFLGLPEPDPLVIGANPDPSIIKKNRKKNLEKLYKCIFKK